MGRIVTLGEIMLRLSPQGYNRFVQAKQFNAFYGGSEANVAVSLAVFGKDVSYTTKLPDNAIAQCAINELRKYGVNTKDIVRGGDRIGLYFCENGESQRPAKLVYDRKDSAIAKAKREDFNWDKIFDGADWFHFSGITPALSDECAKITLDAVKAAKAKGLTVSIDLNYRENLWDAAAFSKAIRELLQYCDVALGSIEEAELAIGEGDGDDCNTVLKKLVEKFQLKYATIILRNRFTAEDVDWTAVLYDGSKFYNAKKYDIHVVDNIGGGDAFAASLIYAITSNFSNQEIIEFATAGSCLKYSMNGDVNLSTVDEIIKLMNGDGSGKVSR
ncbi:2-dehydro-3-deoxygluconokinase [Clostridium acetobutylicum]|uniref:Sugar kinase, ribokinase family n=1 Tax=Clostridium acetobutylicum (strain ATCC 824 / DSM 792 / JCM 1419 / IAM 19013 / LMG 5710 / NBRC 13948 / NRRL B-527 / VKM B-1787 / 2291 / W) TaxID=272562 RepID=Q97FP4_CLOAB|nr:MULTISPECIES: sugar kinase [Clostridium]AAK80631.1 Sugar kinase, ribokinase family [Clostridium acetobutylicum ATCC 824]ADZ21730.1 Sugar kinase, ribokinase family [Clostridium acetobutylicum EA 2018]AEI32501.1 ribokinase family sugar kinase [Clostridium acetobutylicum DSM 1731]AWV78952.1 sugar kinase [Clostridium acetobutylicum]MBC2395192.1 sugar kinase [Clostridium acetobutylicum]